MNRAIILLSSALLASGVSANTLIDNVNGMQVGADGKLERFVGLVFDDGGKVVQLLHSTDEKRPAGITARVDGRGNTLLPGLIDAHGHVMALGLAALQLDVTASSSLQDLQERLRSYASANPQAAWITGRGWNQELWATKAFPTATDLDAIVSDRPVVLERVDGHALVANSPALKAAGVTAETKDPVGGKIERDASGRPTGLLVDNAMELVGKVVPEPTEAERDRALMKTQEALLSVGITAVADMGTSAEDWKTFRRAGDAGRLQFRIMSYAYETKSMLAVEPNGPTPWLYGDRLRMAGLKLYADGALGSRGAWLKRPYADKPDTRGLQFLKDEELRAKANEAAKRNIQVAVHAIGDAANAQVISIYEQLSKSYPGDRRWRIEHFQIADPADIPRLAPAGIIASMQPTHQTSDRLMAEKRLGPDRLAGAYAWQTVLKSGARIAFGSDFPVESPNPFPGLSAAISREDVNGQPPGGWIPGERVTFEQALSGFTREAAYASFAEDRIGALEPGKWADFIIVDRDPTKVTAQNLAGAAVLETWVAGKKLWALTGGPSALPAQPERGR